MKDKLELVKRVQDKYKDAYLGGSLGLLMHGVDVRTQGREIGDLDFTKKTPLDSKGVPSTIECEDGSDDMMLTFEQNGIKVEFGLFPEATYEEIFYEGVYYRVSPLWFILGHKLKYALKGAKKHISDVEYLIRKKPLARVETTNNDDLPF